jgi:4-hydroxybenzoate polyprenyltransferase
MTMPRISVKAYAQLLRIPNVFTALADICLGWLASGGFEKDNWTPFWMLLAASACLYSAGMVLNDFFDIEIDRKERPFRPIPSGRVSRRVAGLLGLILLLCGIGFAVWCPDDDGKAVLIAAPLAVCIVLYDSWLKHFWIGPLGMGMCRFLNVLLGQSSETWHSWTPHLAAVVGVYIVGVTWFARREAGMSSRRQLVAAASVMVAAVVLALLLPAWFAPSDRVELLPFPYLVISWAFAVGMPVVAAIRCPEPAKVQAAIKRCLMGLVGLDAVLAFAFVGWPALAILLLLLPALWLGRWVYST